MTPEERAAEVDIAEEDRGDMHVDWRVDAAKTRDNIAAAIRKAVAAEREACAGVAESQAEIEHDKCLDTDGSGACREIAEAIRKRGTP